MAQLRNEIYRLLEERHPMTCRQLFYQMVSAEMIPKTEASYKNIVVRLCGEVREADELPWEWLADSTRWMHKPDSYSSLEQAIARTARTYRHALWDEQDAYVEVWCEKEALGNILYEITSESDVPLMIVRGFPSKDFVHSAAVAIEDRGKPVEHEAQRKRIGSAAGKLDRTEQELRLWYRDLIHRSELSAGAPNTRAAGAGWQP